MLANCLFSRDPERPFDTERPRNWGSFGAELKWVKAVAKGWFQMLFGRLESFWQAVGGSFLGGWLLGGWLVVENASKQIVFFLGIRSVRLTPNVRGIGARLEQNSMG